MIIHCPQGGLRKTQVTRAENDLRDANRKREGAREDNFDYIARLEADIAICRAKVKSERDLLREHEKFCPDCTRTEQRGRKSALPSTTEIASLIADDGLDLDEVAAIYDVASGTVRQALYRAGFSMDGTPVVHAPKVDVLAELSGAGLAPPGVWAEEGLCAQADPDAWFPEKGGSTREGKAICARCPVAAECLDYALANNERFGIWGGMSERERRRLTKPNPAA